MVGGYFLGTMKYLCLIYVGVFESDVVVMGVSDWLACAFWPCLVLTRSHLRVDMRSGHGKGGC
jgi:hypothetical protein